MQPEKNTTTRALEAFARARELYLEIAKQGSFFVALSKDGVIYKPAAIMGKYRMAAEEWICSKAKISVLDEGRNMTQHPRKQPQKLLGIAKGR